MLPVKHLLTLAVCACTTLIAVSQPNNHPHMNNNLLFFEAVTANDLEKVLQLLQQNASFANARNPDGYTPLMLAAGRGYEKIVSALLQHGADPHTTEPAQGSSALHIAAVGGDTAVAALLVQAGAQINLQAPAHGMTPLMNAVWYRNPEMVRWLLQQERINADIKNNLGITAENMVDAGSVAPNNQTTRQPDPDAQLMTAYFAAFKKQRAAVNASRELIATVANYDGNLDEMQMAEKVKALIKQGADVNAREYNNCRGNDYHTPLLIAARDGKAAVVQILLDAGADLTLTCELMKANAAHKAAYNGHAPVLKALAAHPDFHKIKNAQGPYNGYTPLHDAIWHGHTEAAKAILAAGVDTSLKGLDGLTPVALAKKYGYTDIVKLLE